MTDLRVRFGVILAMALAPLLIFAVIQSFYDYRFEREANQSAIALSARNASAAIVDAMDSVETILKVVAFTVEEGPDCNAALTDVLTSYPRIDDLAIVTPDGASICHAKEQSALGNTIISAESFSPDQRYSLKTITRKDETGRSESAVVMSYANYENEAITRFVIARIKLNALKGLANLDELDANANLAILNSEGDMIIGPANALPQRNRRVWVEQAQAQGQYHTEITSAAGQPREVYTIPSIDENIFIAVSFPKTSMFSWSVLHPFSSLFVPVFAWAFAFIAIWLSTEKLILTHIRKLRRATRRFADGNQDSRVGDMGAPPQSIQSLGTTFDYMADEITSRESALTDSLDEKETLLREIHHRVKNNLQIIISLLNMQERKLKDPKGLEAVRETRNRINAIALVHRGLYESTDLRYVDMQTFIQRLTDELGTALGCAEKNITIDVDAKISPLEADTAIPVALYIVEAIVNSVKHGVSEGGDVRVDLSEADGGAICVDVTDSGQGFSEADAILGTGTKLMNGFARQLGGQIERKISDSGHTLSLRFTLRVSH